MTETQSERGSALVIAIVLTALMLATALGALAFVDRSQRRSGTERTRETTFNFAEAMLHNELLVTASAWPNTALKALPPLCTTAGTNCPDASQALAGLAGPDVLGGVTWETSVRDNIGSSATYYTKAATDATACGSMVPCTWDSNGDGALWIRSDATVANERRSLVALVRQEVARVTLPRTVITAGWFKTSNNGQKTIIDEKGCQAKQRPASNCNATDPGPIAVRCTSATAGTPGDACLGYRSAQVAPAVTTQGYVGNVLPAASLAAMKTYAIQLGTYYTTCPTTAQLTGLMVFVDGASCTYNGGTANSAASPGVLVVNAGTISFGGSVNFYGLLFAANNLTAPADAGTIVSLTGAAYVQGAIFVEGPGGIIAGSSGLNVSFDPNVFSDVRVAGYPSIVQNSFRELPMGQ